MRPATSIRDLMRIRAYPQNREYLDSINGNLGTALGIRNTKNGPTGEPAIIVFVPQKIKPKWLNPSQVIKETLDIPGEIECPIDVVGDDNSRTAPSNEYDRTELSDRLRGWDDQLWPGSKITRWTDQSYQDWIYGTLGVFARQKYDERKLGFITNEHVAGRFGQKLYHPALEGRHIGTTQQIIDYVDVKDWYDNSVAEPDTYVRADCAFVELEKQINPLTDINLQLMTSIIWGPDGKGNFGGPPSSLGPLQQIMLDEEISRLVDLQVMRIGAATGPRVGKIKYFGYEFGDYQRDTFYTDFIIENYDNTGSFSSDGDSGSLIVTTNGYNPIGLNWGGWQARLASDSYSSPFCMAVDLSRVLNSLKLELVYELSSL